MKMKKVTLILAILLIGYFSEADAKCKFKKKIDNITQKLADQANIRLDQMTRPAVLFSKYRTMANISMAKGDGKYYLVFNFMRTDSKKFELLKDLYLSNGEKIKAFPCGDFSGRYIGLSFNFLIGAIYSIDAQQLQKLVGNNVDLVDIHYTSEREINGSQMDKEGKQILEYEIKSNTYKASAGQVAGCILGN